MERTHRFGEMAKTRDVVVEKTMTRWVTMTARAEQRMLGDELGCRARGTWWVDSAGHRRLFWVLG